ncbi:hypothetical protein LTR09_005168 [Extremus antarcticus]|uniref:FAD dependent oxidoreductase domain-containing protein n=1 Tax=Extremus antarcticus TaxID=702011 RepID=A0AAJ0G8Z7_9PEZI|nr:hypothetical protein LTR09_005168 [Extremus antarcticus]
MDKSPNGSAESLSYRAVMNNAFFPTRIPRFDHLSLCSTLQSCVIFLISWRSFLAGNDFGLALNATYDYVIVGGGTAGLAVAYRLAEDGAKSVAVIEAGGFYEYENGNRSVVPAYRTLYSAATPESATQYPLVEWGFVTQPEEGLGGRRLHYGRGKTLGGR